MTAGSEAVAFDTLIYTDCVPGQGLGGAAGLQFQARSPDADREAMAVVQRSLLYEPPDPWMRERRPTSDYPPSFAHVHDGLYATASGVYLGREANGGREGNQLTHSIVTRNPDSYGLIRPAQLFQAPFWTTRPAPSTTCTPIGAQWEPGPFDAVAAKDFVRSRPQGEQRLVALLSALDQIGTPDGRRVLFIAEDPAEVLRWIAAATMLIPQRRAVSIGIKVFTTNPAYASQPVLAVHPGWSSTSATVDNDAGYVVFDLMSGDWSVVAESDQARRRVQLFLQCEEPYDVLDVIEVGALVGLSLTESLDLGLAMVMPGGPMSEPLARLAVNWLRDTSPGLLASYRGVLVDRLVDGVERWPRVILVDLDQVAVSGQVPQDRIGPVRLALIRAEVETVMRDPAATGVPLRPLPKEIWESGYRSAAEDLVRGVLSEGLAPPVFDAVLRAAKRLGVRMRLADIAPAVDEFVADWADHPRRSYAKADWDNGEELEGVLREELTRRILAGDAERVGAAWWERFLPGLEDIETDLDRTLLAAAIRHGPSDLRTRLIGRFVEAAAATGRPERVIDAAQCLWELTPATPDELRLLCRLLPDGPVLPDHLFEPLTEHLTASSRLQSTILDLARELERHNLYRPPPRAREILDDNVRLGRMYRALPSAVDATEFDSYVTLVQTADPRLTQKWARAIADALRAVGSPKQVERMLAVLPRSGRVDYLQTLLNTVADRPAVAHVVTAFYLSWSELLDPKVQKDMEGLVIERVARTSKRSLKDVADAVDELGDPWPNRWVQTVQAASAGTKHQGWLPWGRGRR